MNRRDRRRAAVLGNTDLLHQQKILFLQGVIADLHGQLEHAKQVEEMHLIAIRKAQTDGKLTVVISDDVPNGNAYIDLKSVRDYEERVKIVRVSDRDFLVTMSDLRVLIAQIDAAAGGYSSAQLKDALFDTHMDEALSAALTAVIRNVSPNVSETVTDALALINRYVSSRVAGIQAIQRDGGAALRRVVAESSDQWGELAKRMMEKPKQGPQAAKPETERLANYAQRAKYEQRQNWEHASLSILTMLRDNCRDDIDRAILKELEYRQDQFGKQGLREYVKNTYHGHEDRKRKNVS